MKRLLKLACLFVLALCAGAAFPQSYTGMTVGHLGNLNGFRGFCGQGWCDVVTNAAVDSTSSAWVTEMGANRLHMDFANQTYGYYGIPYCVVDSSVTPLKTLQFLRYPDESDKAAAPIASFCQIESQPPDCVPNWNVVGRDPGPDYHMIVVDKATGWMWQWWQATPCNGAYAVSNGDVWNMAGTELRPINWTSADVAGLSIFPALAKYEEATTQTVAQTLPDSTVVQTLGHALRWTTALTRCARYVQGSCASAYVAPATHAGANNSGTNNIMGMKIRLKASFDTSAFSGVQLVILNTLKTYGMTLADNGSKMYVSGTPDSRWPDLTNLGTVTAASFEVVAKGSVSDTRIDPVGSAPTNTTPTASSSTVVLGQCTVISWTSSSSSYDFLESGPPSRTGSASVCPSATSSYTLQSTNQFGRTAAAPVTVKVLVPKYVGITPIGVQ